MLCKKTVASAIFAGAVFVPSASAQLQDGDLLERCGFLFRSVEGCLMLAVDGDEFVGGFILDNVGGFKEGDHVFVAGIFEGCQGACFPQGCLRDNTIEVCPPIPTTSEWGLAAMTLVVLIVGAAILRAQSRARGR